MLLHLASSHILFHLLLKSHLTNSWVVPSSSCRNHRVHSPILQSSEFSGDREAPRKRTSRKSNPQSRKFGGEDSKSDGPVVSRQTLPRRKKRNNFHGSDYLDASPRRSREAKEYRRRQLNWWQEDTSKPGGFMRLMRGFYNAIIWYGVAYDDDENYPASDFKDLMEQYGNISNRDKDLSSLDESSRRSTEEEYDSEDNNWKYRWNNKANSERSQTSPAKQQSVDDQVPNNFSTDFDISKSRKIQLQRRSEELRAKYDAFNDDLTKVEERLGVLDATLELWLRRGRAISKQNRSDSSFDAELSSTKRRIYIIREEARALENSRKDLLIRLDNCTKNINRIDRELNEIGFKREELERKDENELERVKEEENSNISQDDGVIFDKKQNYEIKSF